MNRQANLIQDAPAGFITKRHIFEANITLHLTQFDRLFAIRDLRLGVDDLQITFEPRDPLRVTLNHGINLLDRAEENIRQKQERHEIAHVDSAIDVKPRSADHHKHGHQTHHHITDRDAFRHCFIREQFG
ncbi:hypothetical protein D3C74_413050 [compost metagenome]